MRPRIKTAIVVDESTQAQRIIAILSELYGYSYSITKRFYYHFNCNVQSLRIHLSYMAELKNETLIIN